MSQTRLARAVAVALVIVLLAALPFRDFQGSRDVAFIAVVDTTLFLMDLAAAVLLYTQFCVLRSRGLLALAMGYLFSSFMVVPHLLTFPGLLAPTGLLGPGLQSTVWLYILWHLGLPIGVISYTLLKPVDRRVPAGSGRASVPILLSVAVVIALVFVLAWFATVDGRLLPSIMLYTMHAKAIWRLAVMPPIWALIIVSIGLLWWRRSSVLDLWLLVVLWAWLIESLLLGITLDRFSVVWYIGRILGLLAASCVLLVLLYESMTLYARLALHVAAQDQDRDRDRQRLTLDVTAGLRMAAGTAQRLAT